MTPSAVSEEKNRIVHIRLRPLWAYLDGIREFSKFFCTTTFDESVADRAQLAIHEMLENAVKYSEHESSDVELSILTDGEHIEISVTNLPSPESLRVLRAEFESLVQRAPEAAYADAMSRASSLPANASRLGLARMRFEGNFELSMSEERDGRVRVTAYGRL